MFYKNRIESQLERIIQQLIRPMIVIGKNISEFIILFYNKVLILKKELENAYKMIKYLQTDNTTIKSRSDPIIYLDKSLFLTKNEKCLILFI